MVATETSRFFEALSGVEGWLGQIESQWRQIPEFKADPQKLRHLAIICDGNRRAARGRGLPEFFGHRAGVETIRGIARGGREWGINTLTFWTWSTENWSRDEQQIKFVMALAEKYLKDEELVAELQQNEVRFTHLGRKDRLPPEVIGALLNLEEKTADFDRFHLNLAMDYGGLDEVARAIVGMFTAFGGGAFSLEMIKGNPQAILGFLDTATQTLPDLVIRTGVEKGEIPHTSGFMPLQTAYSAWVFLPDLFPDLTPQSLLKPIKDFLEYERRFGR